MIPDPGVTGVRKGGREIIEGARRTRTIGTISDLLCVLQVKHLTRDWRTTAHALKYSVTLELNEDHRKVRRTTPVPLFPNENLPSKMLLVYDLYLSPKLWDIRAKLLSKRN